MSWYQPQLTVTGGIRLPHWQQAGDYVAMLARSRMGLPDRVLCSAELVRCCWQMRRQLVLDVVDGAVMVARGKRARRLGTRHEGVVTGGQRAGAESPNPVRDVLHLVASPSGASSARWSRTTSARPTASGGIRRCS